MDSLQRTKALFDSAKRVGLVGINGDGAPTINMVQEAINDAENDLAPEADELAMYVRRLARIVKKSDPSNPVVASAVEFLKCTGRTKILSR